MYVSFFILESSHSLFTFRSQPSFSFPDAARKGRVEIVQHLVGLHFLQFFHNFLSSYPIHSSAPYWNFELAVWSLPRLPRSRGFRLRAVARVRARARVLTARFFSASFSLCFPLFSPMARAMPSPTPHPTGLSSLSLASQPTGASSCLSCLITYFPFSNPIRPSVDHIFIHSTSHSTGFARCATRLARPQVKECDRVCKEARRSPLAT